MTIVEKSLKIPFSELTVVRIVCGACNTGMDMPLPQLAGAGLRCPGCGATLRLANIDQALKEFVKGFQLLQQQHPGIELQFVLPNPE